jgi:hypothetical protein
VSDKLPDTPDTWGEETPEGYRQRWVPGAFGENRETIHGVITFKVLEDEWVEEDDGSFSRIIRRAEVVHTSPTHDPEDRKVKDA